MGKAYIGTSGWNYKHWSQGVFYPKDLKPSEWLKYFVGYFDSEVRDGMERGWFRLCTSNFENTMLHSVLTSGWGVD